MSNSWKFKIDLKSTDVFGVIKGKYGVEIPKDLREFIVENNASSPEYDKVDINGVERVYGETLSFNENEDEVTTFFFVKEAFHNDELIPFAVDPFGNYFCYCIESGTIAFYDHEEERVDQTEMSLEDFLNSLHG